MGFVTELVGSMIRSNMENPEHRDAHFKSHMAGKYIEANKLKEGWRQPTKPWGYWKADVNHAKFWTNSQPAVNRLPGRAQEGALY